MPNDANVTSPVTLLGIGRSGTSLIAASFGLRQDFIDCGETGGLIFGMWEGAKLSFVPMAREYWELFATDEGAKCSFYVQESLKALFPSDRPNWFQKPAGLPLDFLNLNVMPGIRSPVSGFPVEWYWNVFDRSFPNGRFVTVLRNPFDVALSRLEHSGWNAEAVLRDCVKIYEIIEHGWDKFKSIMIFDDLVSDFPTAIRKLCADIDVPFDPVMLNAAERNHAAVAGRGPLATHKEKWDQLAGVNLSSAEINLFQRVWCRLGRDLEIPASCAATGG